MSQFEPHSPRELRAQIKHYFSRVLYHIGQENKHSAALNASRLAHFGLRLLEHPQIKLELAKAHALEEAVAEFDRIEAEEKAREEADAAVVAKLTAPPEDKSKTEKLAELAFQYEKPQEKEEI